MGKNEDREGQKESGERKKGRGWGGGDMGRDMVGERRGWREREARESKARGEG